MEQIAQVYARSLFEVAQEQHKLDLVREQLGQIDEDGGHRRVRQPHIRRLSPALALPRILAGTAGHRADDPARLARQFEFVTRLVTRVPIKTLAYDRGEGDMFLVRDAVLADLAPVAGAR